MIARNAWIEAGIAPNKECAAGDKNGLCWVPTSQYPDTAKRSQAGLGHYLEVLPRSNYDVLLKHKVIKVVYDGAGNNSGSQAPPKVEIRSLETNETSMATAKLEVVGEISFRQNFEAVWLNANALIVREF